MNSNPKSKSRGKSKAEKTKKFTKETIFSKYEYTKALEGIFKNFLRI